MTVTPSSSFQSAADRTSDTDDQRIEQIVPLPPPEHLIRFFPIADSPTEMLVKETRRNIVKLLSGESDRLLVIIGPCSIHDPQAAIEYARRLLEKRNKHAAQLEIIMRVYFEKPRTTVGWKGLINDPYLDGSFRIDEGLRIARDLLVQIHRLGMPAASEFLDVISPQYIGDLISWGAIGARTTESQVHRELASGLSAPVGFKNGTDGNVRIAIDAIQAASRPHHFLSVHKNGQVATVRTCGNKDCHVILRGGKTPNYTSEFVKAAVNELKAAGVSDKVMIDFSHANSDKNHERQKDVCHDVARQIAEGSENIFGVMIESHLQAGNQKLVQTPEGIARLEYGKSITDACLGWEDSVRLLDELAQAVQCRHSLKCPVSQSSLG